MQGTDGKRWLELDALRAFAVLLVVWSHSSNREIGLTGFDGVLLFFVISGFLITQILLEARGAAPRAAVLRAFYARRFLRIFPIYYAVLFLTAALAIPNVRDALPWHFAYLSNWFYGFGGTPDKAVHLWSLSVEEQFYLFWPAVVLSIPGRALPWALAGMILTGPISRVALGSMGAGSLAVWTTTPAVLDALGLGCLLAYLRHATNSADRWARWALCGGVGLVALEWMARKFGLSADSLLGLAITTLGWRLLCFWLVHRAARGVPGILGALLRVRPLVFIGAISYGIYLIHPFVIPTIDIAEKHFQIHIPVRRYLGLSQFASVAAISIGIAALSWFCLERPLNSLKRFFPYVPKGEPGPGTIGSALAQSGVSGEQ